MATTAMDYETANGDRYEGTLPDDATFSVVPNAPTIGWTARVRAASYPQYNQLT